MSLASVSPAGSLLPSPAFYVHWHTSYLAPFEKIAIYKGPMAYTMSQTVDHKLMAVNSSSQIFYRGKEC